MTKEIKPTFKEPCLETSLITAPSWSHTQHEVLLSSSSTPRCLHWRPLGHGLMERALGRARALWGQILRTVDTWVLVLTWLFCLNYLILTELQLPSSLCARTPNRQGGIKAGLPCFTGWQDGWTSSSSNAPECSMRSAAPEACPWQRGSTEEAMIYFAVRANHGKFPGQMTSECSYKEKRDVCLVKVGEAFWAQECKMPCWRYTSHRVPLAHKVEATVCWVTLQNHQTSLWHEPPALSQSHRHGT